MDDYNSNKTQTETQTDQVYHLSFVLFNPPFDVTFVYHLAKSKMFESIILDLLCIENQ